MNSSIQQHMIKIKYKSNNDTFSKQLLLIDHFVETKNNLANVTYKLKYSISSWKISFVLVFYYNNVIK